MGLEPMQTKHAQILLLSEKLMASSLPWTCISFSNDIKGFRNCNQSDRGEYCINEEGVSEFRFESDAVQIKHQFRISLNYHWNDMPQKSKAGT